MKHIYKILNSLILAYATLLTASEAYANRLQDAAQRGQSVVISVGQITAVIGVVLGGIALSIGMANLGRMVLMSGVIGAAATFGGPAIIDMMKDIFK